MRNNDIIRISEIYINYKRDNDTIDNFIKFCLIIIDKFLIIWYNKYRISNKIYKIGYINKCINFS